VPKLGLNSMRELASSPRER